MKRTIKFFLLVGVALCLAGCFASTQVRYEAVPVSAGEQITNLPDGRYSVSAEWLQREAKMIDDLAAALKLCRDGNR